MYNLLAVAVKYILKLHSFFAVPLPDSLFLFFWDRVLGSGLGRTCTGFTLRVQISRNNAEKLPLQPPEENKKEYLTHSIEVRMRYSIKPEQEYWIPLFAGSTPAGLVSSLSCSVFLKILSALEDLFPPSASTSGKTKQTNRKSFFPTQAAINYSGVPN